MSALDWWYDCGCFYFDSDCRGNSPSSGRCKKHKSKSRDQIEEDNKPSKSQTKHTNQRGQP